MTTLHNEPTFDNGADLHIWQSGIMHVGCAVMVLCAHAEPRLGQFTARNLANCLWALAKMGHNPGQEFMAAVVAQVGQKLPDCNAQNLVGGAQLLLAASLLHPSAACTLS